MMKKRERRNACFACTTPYQVLGAISIAKAGVADSDIFIFDTFSGSADFAKRLESLCIFRNVYAVNCDKTNFFGKGMSNLAIQVQALIQTAFPKRYVSEYLDRSVSYETFYSSSRAHSKLLLQRVLQKRNPKMKVVIYDDGLGSYLENSHVLKASRMRQYVEKLFRWNLFDPKRVSIELYLPEIANIPPELRACPLTEMPRFDWGSDEGRKILKTLFGVDDSRNYEERIILFDNVRGLKARIEMFEKVDECYRTILETAGTENVLFKGHPRSVEEPDIDFSDVAERGVSMEVFYADMDDLDSRILVAYNSTAAYTPKILFGKEPRVIHLHRIVGPPMQENSEMLFKTFLPTYGNKEKFLAPESLEELQQMLTAALEGDK